VPLAGNLRQHNAGRGLAALRDFGSADDRLGSTADSCTAANSVFSLEHFVYLGQQCR
jgi:hypothetical protein